MVDTEYKLKYPIGTRIKFIASERSCLAAKRDDGKEGEVVEHLMGLIGIYLPESGNNKRRQRGKKQTTWLTNAKSLQILPPKGQQLLFDFMD